MTAEVEHDVRLRRGYALGSVATGAFGTVPGLLLLPYLTDSLGIGAFMAGVIVLGPKAWDVLVNPIAGRLSDRAATRTGTRRPFLLGGGLVLAVAFALVFTGPRTPTFVAGLWVVVLFLVCATAFAFFQVPWVAMPAEITDSYSERTRILTWRVAVLAPTILVSGAGAPEIRNAIGGAAGYRVMGVFVAVLILIGVVGSYLGTRTAPPTTVRSSGGTLRQQLAVVAKVRDFRLLLTAYAVQAVAIGTMLAGVDYVARVVLQRPGANTLLFVSFVAPALLVTPLWQRFGVRLGKKHGYVAASVALGVGALLLLGARAFPLPVVIAATAIVGIGYAGAQVFPLAMLPDTAAVDAMTSGTNRIGVFTGVWTAGETLGMALGPGVFAVVLALGDYRSSTGVAVDQPDTAVTAITLGFSIVPALLVALSILALRGYSLKEADVERAGGSA